jgi:hypothetical protein
VMLAEKESVRQKPGESNRRWFSDAFFDLIVWLDDSGEIILVQLSYDPDGVDGLLEWRRASGLSHFTVDTEGRRPARHARTPFLVPTSPPDIKPLVDRFAAEAGEIDHQVVDFVLGILRS